MQPTLFWAWQSDAENSVCRGFIRDTAERSLKSLIASGEVQDAPRIDHATSSISGTPEIAGTIFAKIKAAGLFLGDVTLVGNIGEKRTPNPNVLTETGYAAGVIGWPRIILVMNMHYGPPEDLPFDMKNRRFPLTYTLAPGRKKAAAREKLIDGLTGAIREALNAEHDATTRIVAQLTPRCMMMLQIRADQYIKIPYEAQVTVPSNNEATIDKLLTLGLVESKFVPQDNQVGFFWTYHGLLVKRRLGFP